MRVHGGSEGVHIEPTTDVGGNHGSEATAAEGSSKSTFGSVNKAIEHATLRDGSGAVVITVGPELPQHGESVLKDGVNNITNKFGLQNTQTASLADVKSGAPLPRPGPQDTVYLVGHGEDPGHRDVASPDLGGNNAKQITNVLKRTLQGYGKDEQFKGNIVLEGCHTAVPSYEGNKVTGSSLLDNVQHEMMNGPHSKFFKKALAPEATIAGYHGPSFDDPEHPTYGKASVESPAVRQQLGVKENETLYGQDAVEQRRWRQKA